MLHQTSHQWSAAGHARSVTRSCSALWGPTDCSLLGSSVHGIFQARILEWVAIISPGVLPNPGLKLASPALAGGFSMAEPSGKPHKYYHISPSETKLQAITYLTWVPERFSIDSVIFWSLLVNVLNSELTRAIHKEQSESHDNHNFPRLLFKLENVAIFQLFSKVLSVY